jgi:hypothetical protein
MRLETLSEARWIFVILVLLAVVAWFVSGLVITAFYGACFFATVVVFP